MPLGQETAGNLLLRSLEPPDYALLQPHLERVHLAKDHVMVAPGEPIVHVYFPETCLASIVAISPGGRRAEAGLFGLDGLSGLTLALGAERTPLLNMIQIAGDARRMPADAFRQALARSPALLSVLLRYAHAAAVQTAHTVLSNAVHGIDVRLARWLLMCHDRMPGDELDLTHDFLSLMLGVRRPSVTNTLHILEGAHLIKAVRAHITVRDRPALQAFAGDAYGVPEVEYERLFGRSLTKRPAG